MNKRSQRVKNGYSGEILISTLGLTNDQAAELLGVSYQSISNWLIRCAMPQKHIDRLGEVVNMAMLRASQVRAMYDAMSDEFAVQFTVPDPTDEQVPGWYDMPLEVAERVANIANVWALAGRKTRPMALRHAERTTGTTRIEQAMQDVDKAVEKLRHELKAVKKDLD
jgi:hypothetical protein